ADGQSLAVVQIFHRFPFLCIFDAEGGLPRALRYCAAFWLPAGWPSVVTAPCTSVSPSRMASSDSLSSWPTNWMLALVDTDPWGQSSVTRLSSSSLTGPVKVSYKGVSSAEKEQAIGLIQADMMK